MGNKSETLRLIGSKSKASQMALNKQVLYSQGKQKGGLNSKANTDSLANCEQSSMLGQHVTEFGVEQDPEISRATAGGQVRNGVVREGTVRESRGRGGRRGRRSSCHHDKISTGFCAVKIS